jgi:uncharacterized protein
VSIEEHKMTLSMYQASAPVFLRGLSNLSAILEKAAAQAAERKIDEAVFLQARLAPDMFPLVRQVQIASDHAKGAAARLAGLEVPKFEDVEKSFEELQQRVARTRQFVESVDKSKIEGSEGREISLPGRDRTLTFNGQSYLFNFALPNFFFHATTAYDILRHNGIQIGKRDFLGPVA